MATNIAAHEQGEVARPLNVLVPLIKQDFEEAEQAGMSYYRAAGEKLLEARDGSFEGRVADFYAWAERNFGKKQNQIRVYMQLVLNETKRRAPRYSSLVDFERRGLGRQTPDKVRPRAWHEPVKEEIERAKREAERLREAELTRQQEREAERKLALRLIEIGFKVLAKELHPDKGGSREAMTRLSRVRDRLKQCI